MHHMITKLYIKKHTDLSVPILFPSKIQSQHDMYLLYLLLSWCRSQSMSTPKTMSQTTHPSWFPTWTTWGQTSWCRPSWSRRKLCCWSESREPPRLLWLKWDKKHWEGNVFQNVLSLTHYITHVVTPGSWWSNNPVNVIIFRQVYENKSTAEATTFCCSEERQTESKSKNIHCLSLVIFI